MNDKTILTAESVTAGHPDKLCDTIADTVLDCCLEHDPNARVACEVLATAGKIVVAGEITALAVPDIPSIVRDTVRRAGYNCRNFDVEVLIHPQSPDIAGAVASGDQTGAGDQGIMYGYACGETEQFLPLPVVLAHRLTALLSYVRTTGQINDLRPDGKAQVSVEYEFGIPQRIAAIVLSCQHAEDIVSGDLISLLQRTEKAEDVLIDGPGLLLLRSGLWEGNACQFLPDDSTDSLQQFLLFHVAVDHPAHGVHALAGRNGGQALPCVPLLPLGQGEGKAEPSLFRHGRRSPTSAVQAVHSPWRSGIHHRGSRADTGRLWPKHAAS